MQNIFRNTPPGRVSAGFIIIVTIGLVIASLFAFQFLGLFLIAAFNGFDFDAIVDLLINPVASADTITPLLIIQGVTAIGAFIVAPFIVITRFLKLNIREFFRLPVPFTPAIVLTGLITICFMVVNSIAIDWNQGIELPVFLSGFEEWVQQKEKELELLTRHITNFDEPGQFLLALLVVAVLPGIGEELLFRGVFQNTFHRLLKNPHAAIWLTAFMFSVFHFQFYGLVPRMFLGALFGYLYLWSGNISVAMFAHFLNNGFMIVMIYLNKLGWLNYDITDDKAVPDMVTLLFFAVITGFLLVVYYRIFKTVKDEKLGESV